VDNREKVDFIAERIMGWHMEHDGEWFVDDTGTWQINVYDYMPCDEVEQAIEAAEEWRKQDPNMRCWSLHGMSMGGSGRACAFMNGEGYSCQRSADTPALAIVDALIAALEQTNEQV